MEALERRAIERMAINVRAAMARQPVRSIQVVSSMQRQGVKSINKDKFSLSLNGKRRFLLHELKAIANYLCIDIDTFFDGIDSLPVAED
jgi:hypothetical protein